MKRITSLLVVALFAAFTLPTELFAQAARNTNLSRRFGSVIVGGWGNLISSNLQTAFVGGGQNNAANNTWAVVGGGVGNTNAGQESTIGGGSHNRISGYYTTIGGGYYNKASGFNATIGGGYDNTNGGDRATIGGGSMNTVDSNSFAATIPGGARNTAGADYSFAAGRRAKAVHQGSFVWADSTDADFSSDGTNQFLVRAKFVGINRNFPIVPATEVFGINAPQTNGFGGMYIQTAGAAARPYYGYSAGGLAFAYTYLDGSDGNKWKLNVDGNRITVTPGGLVGIGTNAPAHPLHMASGAYVSAAGVWMDVSDANRKQNFRHVDSKAILAKVVSLPVTKWNYIAEPGVDHIGPMAQDFRAAFGLGNDDKAIGSVDRDGVVYAAIQGLVEELKDRDKAIEELKSELRAVKQRLDSLPPAP